MTEVKDIRSTKISPQPKEAGIYIHIPFCEHKCVYCDFYSIITDNKIGEYREHLKLEMRSYRDEYAPTHAFSSVFFGGGTPSLLSSEAIQELLSELKDCYTISDDAEITLETNPGTVDSQKLMAFKSAGINRLSVGIQSFDDADLKFMTRIHDEETAIRTIELAAEAGFDNISADLIFNLPGQTKDAWLRNLRKAIKLPVTHLSAYSLIIERGTILNKWVLDKKVIISDEDVDAELYEIAVEFLTSRGFQQYEVSNFCLPGYECRHNNHYWRYRDYLGFGTSAHSFMEGKRWWNYRALSLYGDAVQKKGNARKGEETLTAEQQHDEYVMLALRSSGLNIKEYEAKFGADWLLRNKKQINNYIENNFITQESGMLRMTLKGYTVCDEIIKNLL